MHHRKLFLVVILVSLIHVYYAVRVDTNVAVTTEKSESVDDQLPKAEALTLVIHKHVPLRPLKVIERKDDVLVIHRNSNRAKRKQNTRHRRPSNQFRSKIKSSSSSSPPSGSSFGGFKDFTSNEFRFPPFPSKNFKTSSKKKNGPPKSSSYDYSPKPRRPPQRPQKPSAIETVSTIYGPPTINHVESQFVHPVTLQQQQQQNSFPTFSINALEPASTSNFFTNNEVTKYSSTIGNFPLGDGSSFNVPKTSYGEPIRSASSISDTNSYQYNSNVASILSQINKNNNNNNKNNNNINIGSSISTSSNNNFPKLPSKYEESDFSTPTRHNPLNSNSFTSDFANIDFDDSKDALSTFNRQKNRFNKFNNYDYDFRNQKNPLIGLEDDEDDDDDDNFEFAYSTTRRPRITLPPTTTTTTTEATTTRRYKKGAFGKRNKGKVSQDHTLDTDDLRVAYTEPSNSDFHDIALNSDDFLNFDSQRNHRRQAPSPLHEIHSTLKAARRNPALRQALGDDFQIVSIQKSHEQDPNTADLFQRRHDTQRYREFQVGGEINFSQASPAVWNGEMSSFPRNHRLP